MQNTVQRKTFKEENIREFHGFEAISGSFLTKFWDVCIIFSAYDNWWRQAIHGSCLHKIHFLQFAKVFSLGNSRYTVYAIHCMYVVVITVWCVFWCCR